MSATRDKTQKVAFVYQNLYQIYRKGVNAAQEARTMGEELKGVDSGRVLKADSAAPFAASLAPAAAPQISEYRPAELIAKRIQTPAVLTQISQTHGTQAQALSSLKANLTQLNDLHSRLRFMLKELEELVKE